MSISKHTILAWMWAAASALPALAQTNGSNSSYSRFGLGISSDPSQGFNRSMGGVAQGMRSGQYVNRQNPASYAAIDSLSFIFDVGMGLQFGHFSQGGNTTNARNTSLEYVNAGFRVAKGLGMAFGFAPFTSIGYNFTTSNRVGSSLTSNQDITSQTTYYGNGGLHKMYLGVGWNPVADLSIGANINYLWGSYSHSLAQTFYEGTTASSSFNKQNSIWESDINTYKIDLGVQYPVRIGKRDLLTAGATVGLGHSIGSSVSMTRYTTLGDTIEATLRNAFDLPYTFSAGLAWQRENSLTIAADYTLERWKGCKVPVAYTASTTGSNILVRTDQYLNRHRVNLGAEYIQNPAGRKYSQRIRYRMGASYATPNVKVNGQNGPMEYGVTAGMGLPMTFAGKSVLNVGLEWKRRTAASSNLISENYLMLHLGITFNERWFMKWKFN